MHGVKRIVMFCTLTTVLPTILLVVPLYLRHSLYASVVYTVAESDIMEIDDGISTIFCSEHTLEMKTPFHAFKMPHRPDVATSMKHIQLRKSMTLPDDTLEYWGFYLLKGATVALSVCSRFQGASILVVKGERSLRTCGMMDHNSKKKGGKGDGYLATFDQQVKVTVESKAKETEVGDVSPRRENGSIPIYDVAEETDEKKEFDNNSTERELELLREAAMIHIQKHAGVHQQQQQQQHRVENGTRRGIERLRHMRRRLERISVQRNEMIVDEENAKRDDREAATTNRERIEREKRSGDSERDKRIRDLKAELDSEPEGGIEEEDKSEENSHKRNRRNQNSIKPPVLLDRGVEHGGNARDTVNMDEESSISSFENGLLSCYDGQVLLAHQFEPSPQCTNISFLLNSKRIHTQHKVTENGYYYYIFYSDNDFVSNDMHALFDIYKPTFQYENATQSCINQTECSFSIEFLSDERVIVEVPTKNGIDDMEDDITLLTSTCRPRMGIYTIFPIAVLLLVLGCAFL